MFLIRAGLDADALRGKAGAVLSPGMLANLLVLNGHRSILGLLVSPMSDSVFRAAGEE